MSSMEQKTDVTGACFSGADLRGVDLSQVRGLTAQQVSHAIMDHTTTLPEQLRSTVESNTRY